MSGLATPNLRRLISTSAKPERCELCGTTIPSAHRHVLDREAGRTLLCACQPCSILFDHTGERARYRLVRDIVRPLPGMRLDDLAWRALRIPVDVAYVVRDDAGSVRAFYPSPAGLIAAPLEHETWDEIEGENPPLREMTSEVEALLVNRLHGATSGWIVGIDTCYRLVALMRRTWHGMTGGSVWGEIETFFQELRAR
jgi:hypothetical protein